MKHLAWSALLLLLAERVAWAQALTGTKTVGGASPDYATIVAAASAVATSGVGAGGVTFDIRSGTYDGSVLLAGSPNSNPVSFQPELGATVVVTNTTSPGSPVFNFLSGWAVTLRGLNIQAVNQDAIRSNNTTNLLSSFIQNTISVSVTGAPYRVAIDGSSGNNLLVEGNTITLNVPSGSVNGCQGVRCTPFEEGCLVRGNTIVVNAPGGTGHAAVVSGSSPDLIERNVILGNGAAAEIGIYLSGGSFTQRTLRNNVVSGFARGIYVDSAAALIDNNTLSSDVAGAHLGHLQSTGNFTTWRNNIFSHTGSSGMCLYQGSAPSGELAANYNLYFTPSGAHVAYAGAAYVALVNWQGTSLDLNSLEGDPGFVDPAAGNFRIFYASPARDAGTTLAGVPDDLDGQLRPSGGVYDIGADETFGVPLGVQPDVALTDGVVGVAFTRTFGADGAAPMTWSVTAGSLPPGLTLSAGGVYSGTPTTLGSYPFTVTATNVSGSSGLDLVHDIVPAPPSAGGGGGGGGSCGGLGWEALLALAFARSRRRS